MTSKWQDKITKVKNALMGSITDAIGAHNSSNSAHSDIREDISEKQDNLVSGTNIKTINGGSLLGAGNISVKEGAGTFTDLQNLINSASTGDTIVLDKDYKYNSETDNSLTGGVVINKNLTILGNGHILDGNNNARIFALNTLNISVNIIKLSFINGSYNRNSGGGGAIYVSKGEINLINCVFEGNYSRTVGGAIFLTDTSYNYILSCTFLNNSANTGGAIGTANAFNTVVNCLFETNTASRSVDGGNDIYNSDYTSLSIYNCKTSSSNLYNTTNYNYTNDGQIIDNLTTDDATKVLSAKQGKVLQDGKVDKESGKGLFSGSYNDLTDTPTIPIVPSASSTTPSADSANGAIGNSTTWAKADHEHPKSTIYAEASHAHNEYVTATKVTSWQNTPSDSNVPSEKLVKDTIDDYIGDINDYIGE